MSLERPSPPESDDNDGVEDVYARDLPTGEEISPDGFRVTIDDTLLLSIGPCAALALETGTVSKTEVCTSGALRIHFFCDGESRTAFIPKSSWSRIH